MGFFLPTPALWQRKQKTEQVKNDAITFICAVGNATSVASMLVLRRLKSPFQIVFSFGNATSVASKQRAE